MKINKRILLKVLVALVVVIFFFSLMSITNNVSKSNLVEASKNNDITVTKEESISNLTSKLNVYSIVDDKTGLEYIAVESFGTYGNSVSFMFRVEWKGHYHLIDID